MTKVQDYIIIKKHNKKRGFYMEEKYEEIKKTLVKYNQEQLLVNY